MRPLFFTLALLGAATWMPLHAQPSGPVQAATEEAAIAAVLDDFHDAADKGDKARYLGHFTRDGVFMGTDDWERWPLPAFSAYVDERFKDGKGWSYRAVERHVRLAPGGGTAWFDEITESPKWGRFRGTGVLLKQGDRWKIAHYAMSFLVPNEVWEEVSELARAAGAQRARETPVTPAGGE
jgi:ketosteroid isomerase-like protein